MNKNKAADVITSFIIGLALAVTAGIVGLALLGIAKAFIFLWNL